MHFVTDLHLHSKYSRAVSPQMTLPVMATYARQKGLDILTAADFTHPEWLKEIKAQLQQAEEGLFTLKSDIAQKKVRFLLSTEISCIYKQDGAVRRIHNLVFVPSFDTVERFNKALRCLGCNLNADGRPIIGLSAKALFKLLLSIDNRAFLIPCHIWTPHFGVYGSASGFDSLAQAFGELAPQIYGIETGISSDPGMNWQIQDLQNRSILSFSDAHSPAKMGREATVFDLDMPSFDNIRKAIMYPNNVENKVAKPTTNLTKQGRFSSSEIHGKEVNRIAYTVEFYPEEGKYHFSGHRKCKVAQAPDEIRKSGNICPVCKKRFTEGVLYRVEQLSNYSQSKRVEEKLGEDGLKWFTDLSHAQPPYIKLVPLIEIVAQSLDSTVNSQRTKNLYIKLCMDLGSELNILLKTSVGAIEKVAGAKLAHAISKVRKGEINIKPGYDGEYGRVSIWKYVT